ncbi:MAG: esterase [Neptuniibacter caesariensis]|uniref:Esterase n=1 Tax=Neptuniibacter caesariensis TaxID=207954 RepID=A0A2G6JBH9_NEPCE|nr:MAG: esterase [Neptuniibacter caesariensis]
MKQTLFIYVHGFNSSPQSMKARVFKDYMQAQGAGEQVQVPALSHWPAQAVSQLRGIIEQNQDKNIVLLGSSLGGYYSTWLTEHYLNVRTVLINPAVRPFELLPQYLGENKNLYSGETYTLTEAHMQQLLELNCPHLKRPEAYLLLTQTADETLDYREGVEKFADSPQFVQPGGSHGFEQFEQLIPAILAFAEGRIELPAVNPI